MEDGFNFMRLYSPTVETKQQYKDWVQLLGNHGMQAMTSFNDMAYKLDPNNQSATGVNIYDLADASTFDTYYLNATTAFNEVYNVTSPVNYRDIIWGHIMVGEYNPNSPYPFNPNLPPFNARPPRWDGIGDPLYYGKQLMPISKAQEQFSYYNNSLKASGNKQKLINAPGCHNGHLQVNSSDGDPASYMRPFITSPGMGDVCYDAGYFTYEYATSNSNDLFQAERYLWKMDNIDYERQYFNDVYTEIQVDREQDATNNYNNYNNFAYQLFDPSKSEL